MMCGHRPTQPGGSTLSAFPPVWITTIRETPFLMQIYRSPLRLLIQQCNNSTCVTTTADALGCSALQKGGRILAQKTPGVWGE